MTNSKGSSEAHEELVADIILIVGSSKWARVWKNATGKARSFDGQRVINFGLPGSADIIGILKNGRFLAIECKTGNATQTKKQKNFQKMIETFGGLYLIARPQEDIFIHIIKGATQCKV